MLSLTVLLLASAALAHPGHDHAAEAVERAAALASMGRRSLAHCASHIAARGLASRNAARRAALVQALSKRDAATVLATNHRSNLTGVTADTDADTLFSGSNACILGPETTEGPYYVTGEYLRDNVTDGQAGVPLTVDIQIIDTNTCQPLPNVALDFWHCNSTGVYSGVVANGNGNFADKANINATFLRGIQATDSDGVVQFHTIFPGHYTGRATHIHILAHTEGHWTRLDNNTITGGTTSAHVGQLFMDQDLISQVEAEAPYNTNTQTLTENNVDFILSQEATNIDPFLEYVLLGNSIQDGIVAWIAMGINASATNTVQAAATYGPEGGVANANSMGGGPGGGAPPNGTSTVNGTAAASSVAATGTSDALPIWSMSIPLAIMAAALRFARM
ncbi:aromatic compound dioxygenase [Cutaneotrichosporon oleaginosum]|uniref:Aromatic compound dioxygenase n=1 Tax=Cutaneotrichosporon oleaginosum TaxID=879819 RepID=A0A0J0XSB2_9TREE|nr:aromatic compound dioxygenase [Cutaneotrichosporon oleaginosum]KLT43956.1 aromatic compound dioxygenase [Cutaneotrichosporon oleaginosum]TXT04097.1 hypothetical protein COLE_07794 [Cutaneotrichosporon oleaginosum]